MKLFFLVLAASAAVAGEWEATQRIPLDQKIEITTLSGTRTRACVRALRSLFVARVLNCYKINDDRTTSTITMTKL